jgi:hypothetical protein
MTPYRKKLVEVALQLDAITKTSEREEPVLPSADATGACPETSR